MNAKNSLIKSTVNSWFLSSLCLTVLLVWSTGHIIADDDEQDAAPTVHEGLEAVKRTVGPEKCGECHEAELASWKESAHQSSYATMHKSPLGKSIAKKLGIRRIKKDDSCVRCHYNQLMTRDKPKVKLGVTCESCHGPAKEWMPIHDDFGGKGVTRENESSDHKAQRHQRLLKAGMNHPDQLYFLAARCFSCHVMDEPRLMGADVGHPAGSDFELLTWSQGEVRHNFVTGDGKSNPAADAAHRRVLFGLGRIIEVEYVLAAIAKADAGSSFEAMTKRLDKAARNLQELAALLPQNSGLKAAADALAGLKKTPKNAEYLKLRQDLARLGKSFAKLDGATLSALDPVIPGADKYRGKSRQ